MCSLSSLIRSWLSVYENKKREAETEFFFSKVEVLTQELWQVQQEGGTRVRELEGRLSEQSQRLQVYEKLERELDAVVMQAAESEPPLPVFFYYYFPKLQLGTQRSIVLYYSSVDLRLQFSQCH